VDDDYQVEDCILRDLGTLTPQRKGSACYGRSWRMKEKRWKKGRKKEFGWEDRQKWEAEGRKEKKEEGRNWYDKAVGKVWIGEPRRKRKGGKEEEKK
jgi:hypothetical protein